jgi:hypothetical protein
MAGNVLVDCPEFTNSLRRLVCWYWIGFVVMVGKPCIYVLVVSNISHIRRQLLANVSPETIDEIACIRIHISHTNTAHGIN